jgi:Tol biopolymer transport system component
MIRGVAILASLTLCLVCVVPDCLSAQDPAATVMPNVGTTLPVPTTRHVRFSASEATWTSVDVSPDGRSIVFDLLGDLYLLPIDGGRARRLTSGPAWDREPRFSPDGSQIVFVSDRSGSDNLWLLSIDGTDLRQVGREHLAWISSPTWTPGGQAVIARRAQRYYVAPGDTLGPLWKYPTNGAAARPLITRRRARGDQASGASIDSGANGYTVVMDRTTNSYNLLRVNMRDTSVTQLTGFPSNTLRAVVSRDGRFMAYVALPDGAAEDIRTGVRALLRIRDLSSGVDRAITDAIVDYRLDPGVVDRTPSFSFTTDGRALVIGGGGRIQYVDVVTGAVHVVPFVADIDQTLAPLLHARRRLNREIDVRQLLSVTHIGHGSNDGSARSLLFSAVGRIWVRDSNAKRPRPITPREGAYAIDPALSPDSHWVAYVTLPESSTTDGHVWRVPLLGGVPERLDRGGEHQGVYLSPVWWHDGAHLSVALFTAGLQPADGNSDAVVGWLPSSGGSFHTSFTLSGVYERASGGNEQGLRLVGLKSNGKRLVYLRSYPDDTNPTTPIAHSWATELREHDLQGSGDHRLTLAKHIDLLYAPLLSETLARSADGCCALFIFQSEAYLMPLHQIGGDKVIDPYSSLSHAIRLSSHGARSVQWLDNGRTISWAYANHVWRVPVDDVLKFDRPRWRIKDDVIELRVPRPPSTARTIVLHGGRVITMDKDSIITKADVVIAQGRIQAIGAEDSVLVPTGATVINAAGTTIIPGMIDTHYHPFQMGPYWSRNPEYTRLFSQGITTIRNPGPTSGLLAEAEMTATRVAPTPRIFTTGEVLIPLLTPMRSEQEARSVVTRQEQDGIDFLKQYLQPTRLQRQWVRLIAGQHALNATNEGGDWDNTGLAVDMTMVLDGYTGFEHELYGLHDDVMQLIALSGTTYTPTFPAVDFWARRAQNAADSTRLFKLSPRLRGQTSWRAAWDSAFLAVASQTATIVHRGGRVSLGAHDRYGDDDLSLWTYVEAGMTPMEAIRVATTYGYENIGYGDDFGLIAPGRVADLVVLNSNPLDDIKNIADVRYVMKGGVLYDARSLRPVLGVQ